MLPSRSPRTSKPNRRKVFSMEDSDASRFPASIHAYGSKSSHNQLPHTLLMPESLRLCRVSPTTPSSHNSDPMYQNGQMVTMLSICNLDRRHFLTWRAAGFHPKICGKANQNRILGNRACAAHWSHRTCFFEDRNVILSDKFRRKLESHLRGVQR